MIIPLLGLTLFVSAYLLFWCQPMVAKMMLPLLGGSASVWTTCVLFFQLMLLAGYIYAHLLSKYVRFTAQFVLHIALMLGALTFLPMSLNGYVVEQVHQHADNPVPWLLMSLLITVGFPFFMLSTTAPLLQNWLANTHTDSRRDPYFLYAASNAGSLLSLASYPFLVEPYLGLYAQNRLWAGGYGLLLVMLITGAFVVRRQAGPDSAIDSEPQAIPPSWRTRLFWLTSAFVPSALMLAVTNHISVNLAPIPFLWIVPLGLYLLTFIIAFKRGRRISPAQLSQWSPILFLLLLPIVPDMSPPSAGLNWLLMAGHVGILLFGAFLCHTALAASRPDSRYLTQFYLWLALGGAAGGIFTAVIAPNIFRTVLEYPLLVAMLPFFRERPQTEGERRRSDWIYPTLLGVLFVGSWYALRVARIDVADTRAALLPEVFFFIALFLFRKRTFRFALGFATILIGYTLTIPEVVENGERIYVARNFFGVKKVLFDVNRNMRKLLHGDTLHGVESTDGLKSGQPLSYYHPTGPIGDVMSVLSSTSSQKIAVIGLGTGTMAAYASPTRHITFVDVDPQVETIARNLFTFVRRCAENCDIVVSDGRLALEREPEESFDLIMLDAFSSDSIPTHLVSGEAIRLYRSRLKENGLLLFHVSNRYLRVEKLVCAVVNDAGMPGFLISDREEDISGKSGSDYVIAASHLSPLGAISTSNRWMRIPDSCGVEPWTDDYSNMLSLIRWRRS